MAYAESTVGGSFGGAYRVWVNSIRTYDGGPSENFEDWRVEGGLNKIAGGNSVYNNYNNSSYTVQLGLNGVASSGKFNYNFASGTTGRVLAWGTGATRVYRNSAGGGFGFQSRMDINLQNSPYLTSGWVTSNDNVQTKYRHASVTALSTDSGGIPFTDEGPAWIEFSNPSGAAVDAWLEMPDTVGRIFTSGSIGSRYNYDFNTALIEAIQQGSPNSNTYTIRMGVHDSMGGDSWDWRDRTGTIKNDVGQANPLFSNYTYKDTNATTVAVTGSDQVLVQGKSTIEVKVAAADKATPQKFATMSTYSYTLGGISLSAPWSNTLDVVTNIGSVTDVSGTQSLSVRAVDSRGNGKTVSKDVTVLPYANPLITPSLDVKYANDYDISDGITVKLPSTVFATISPMTLAGSDKNAVVPASGVKFDMSVGSDTSYTGTKVNVPTTRVAGSTDLIVDIPTLEALITNKMEDIGPDNSDVWFIKFEITDKLGTVTEERVIEPGRSIFRIGADSILYYNEVEMNRAFNPTNNVFLPGISAIYDDPSHGVYTPLSGFAGGSGAWTSNAPTTDSTFITFPVYLTKGTYKLISFFAGGSNVGITTIDREATNIANVDGYRGSNTEVIHTATGLVMPANRIYFFNYYTSNKNASSSGYLQRVLAIHLIRTGN